jgi:hypothetical protein
MLSKMLMHPQAVLNDIAGILNNLLSQVTSVFLATVGSAEAVTTEEITNIVTAVGLVRIYFQFRESMMELIIPLFSSLRLLKALFQP